MKRYRSESCKCRNPITASCFQLFSFDSVFLRNGSVFSKNVYKNPPKNINIPPQKRSSQSQKRISGKRLIPEKHRIYAVSGIDSHFPKNSLSHFSISQGNLFYPEKDKILLFWWTGVHNDLSPDYS